MRTGKYVHTETSKFLASRTALSSDQADWMDIGITFALGGISGMSQALAKEGPVVATQLSMAGANGQTMKGAMAFMSKDFGKLTVKTGTTTVGTGANKVTAVQKVKEVVFNLFKPQTWTYNAVNTGLSGTAKGGNTAVNQIGKMLSGEMKW